MNDLLTKFINTYTNIPNVGDTPENKGQCVGLVEVYTDSLSLPHTWGNAKDLLADADPNSFEIIYNTPTNFPLPGDIFVCGATWGIGKGHTGIIVTADPNSWTGFEQNNPVGHAPEVLTHTNYNGMLGWLHPKLPPTTTPTPTTLTLTDQTKYDFGDPYGVQEMGAVRSMLHDKDLKIDNLTKQLDSSPVQPATGSTTAGNTLSSTTLPLPQYGPTESLLSKLFKIFLA